MQTASSSYAQTFNGHTTDNHCSHGWIFPLSCHIMSTDAYSSKFPTYQLVSLMNCHHTSVFVVASAAPGAQTCRRHPHLVHRWVIAKMGSCSRTVLEQDPIFAITQRCTRCVRTGGSAIESNDLTSHLGGWVCNGLCITMYNQCYWKQFNFKNTWEDGFVMVYESLCITSILKPFTGWCFIHILHLSIPEIGMMIPNH